MLLNKIYFINFIIFFFLVYGVTLSVGVTIYSVQVLMIIFSLLFVIQILYCQKIDRIMLRYLLYLLPFILYVVLYTIPLAKYTDSIVFSGLILLIIALVVSLFISKYYFSKLTEYEILNIVFVSTTIFSFIILLMVVIEPFKDFIYSFIKVRESFLESNDKFRVIAPNGMAGAYLSVVLSLGLVAGLLITKTIFNIRFIVYSSIILMSMVFIGRSGIFLFFLLLPLIYLVKYINRKTFSSMTIFRILGVVLFLFFIFFFLYASSDFLSSIHPGILRLFRMLNPIIEGGIFNDPTIIVLLENHYFLPNNFFDLCFGIGTSGRNETQTGVYLPSDVGFVRLTFAYGVLGSVFLYGFYFIIFIKSFRNLRNSILMKFVFLTSIFIFIFHFKEVGFGTIILSIMLFISYFSYLYILRRVSNDKTITYNIQ